MKKLHNTERGQALIIIAFAAVALFAFAALAIDGSIVFSDRRHAQNAADTAALAAALAKTRQQAYIPVAFSRAASNGYNNNGTSNVVEVYMCSDTQATCTALPADAIPSEYVQVKITSHVKTYFARVIGRFEVTNRVNAVARATPSQYKEMYAGNAVVSLAPHECKAIVYQGNAESTITGGGILDMSDCTDSAFFNNSAAAQLTAPSLCSVGGIDYRPGAINIPSILQGKDCVTPPAIVEPNPECQVNAQKHGNTMTPGNWTGQFPPAGVDTLESGIYCVDGDFRLNGGDSLTGHGVVIRMNDGVVTWNGGAEIHLDAPTEGSFQGLLMYLPSNSNCSPVTLNGNSDSTIVGSILAPCSEIKVEGSGDSGIEGQIIGYTVNISGTSGTDIHYVDQLNWDAPIQPTVNLNQ
ncbi:MAG: pilus assembly protein TadG-related protein [Bacteroidota bacterium]